MSFIQLHTSPDSGLCGSITNNIIYCAHSVHFFCTHLLQGINNFPTYTNRNSTDQNVRMYYYSSDLYVPNYTSSGLNLLPGMVVLGTEPSLTTYQCYRHKIVYICPVQSPLSENRGIVEN